MIYDVLHERMAVTHRHNADSPIVNQLMQKCISYHGECNICATIICPHHSDKHFNASGCPECAAWEAQCL